MVISFEHMEPQPIPDPRPQPQTISPLLRILAIVGVIVILAAAAYWVFVEQANRLPFPKEAEVTVSLGYVPASPLVSLSQDRARFVPRTFAGVPEGSFVIDRIATASGEYLLVLDSNTSVSNIMRSQGDGAELAPVTTSQTMKFDLSYDPATDTFVYLSKSLATAEEFLTTRDWNVTVLRAGTERTIGTGLHAEAVPGANAAIVGSFDGTLSWRDLDALEEVLITKREQAWVFAVKPDGSELALYNPLTREVDRFDVTQGARALRPLASEKVLGDPSSLAYLNDSIVVSRSNPEQSATIFSTAGSTRELTVPHPVPGVASSAYNLSIDL